MKPQRPGRPRNLVAPGSEARDTCFENEDSVSAQKLQYRIWQAESTQAGVDQSFDTTGTRELLGDRELLVVVVAVSEDKIVADSSVALWAQVVVVGTTGRVATATGSSHTVATMATAKTTDGHHLGSVEAGMGSTRYGCGREVKPLAY